MSQKKTESSARVVLSSLGKMSSRFQGDVPSVRDLGIWGQELMSHIIVIAVGSLIMLQLSPTATGLIYIPLLLSVLLVNLARKQIERYRSAARKAEGGRQRYRLCRRDFQLSQAVKVADAIGSVDTRFREVNQARHKVALRDALFSESLQLITANTNNIGVGIVLEQKSEYPDFCSAAGDRQCAACGNFLGR